MWALPIHTLATKYLDLIIITLLGSKSIYAILENMPSVHISGDWKQHPFWVDVFTQYCPLCVDWSPVPDSVTFKNIFAVEK